MEMYLLAINFIVANKLLGGIPSKIIEHIIINNAVALTWWGTTKLLYGMGHLAMLPFKTTNSQPAYNLLDTMYSNEYIIETKSISTDLCCVSNVCNKYNEDTIINSNIDNITNYNIDNNTDKSTNTVTTTQKYDLINDDWEIINRDDSKIILVNGKKGNQIIITKQEHGDIVIIDKPK